MDLFVINRYRDSDEEVNVKDQELNNFEKLKQKIEERKRTTNKISNVIPANPCQKEEKEINQKIINSENVYDERNSSEQILVSVETNTQNNIYTTDRHQEFKVLGVNDFEKKAKVQRILPYWLSHPHSISTNLQDLVCAVDEADWLHSSLKSTLSIEGVTHLFPVQEQVIPFILEQHMSHHPFWPHDVCVSAPTGSGKTLAFVLPIIQVLMDDIGHHIRALIVLPVQELATQVSKVFKKYVAGTRLKVALLSGSTPFHQEQLQIVRYTESLGWVSEVDIIVCTAGRLVEHIQNTEGFSLKYLKFLVIDEADRIMDHIQNDWLYHMDRHIKLENELMTGKVSSLSWNNLSTQKAPPHKLLFSATLSQDPEKLEQWSLFQPKLFSAINHFDNKDNIRKFTTPAELREQYITCTAEHKPLVLYYLLVEQKWDKVLCFTNSAQSAHRLTVLLDVWLDGKLKVAELSATLNRSTREAVLKKFHQSEINVLIGTDALARGIDIPNCNYVISYDPPRNIKTYIHRVGRTGRAGRIGHAITILMQNQVNSFTELIKSGGKNDLPQTDIAAEVINRLAESYEYAMIQTKNQIHGENNSKVQKSIELKRGFRPHKRKFDQTTKSHI